MREHGLQAEGPGLAIYARARVSSWVGKNALQCPGARVLGQVAMARWRLRYFHAQGQRGRGR
eukprot:1580379-Lingulodinium_polyedra.AAC.1